MIWLDGITDPIHMSLSKLLGIVKDREAWHAAVHGSQRVGHNLATEQPHKEIKDLYALKNHKTLIKEVEDDLKEIEKYPMFFDWKN